MLRGHFKLPPIHQWLQSFSLILISFKITLKATGCGIICPQTLFSNPHNILFTSVHLRSLPFLGIQLPRLECQWTISGYGVNNVLLFGWLIYVQDHEWNTLEKRIRFPFLEVTFIQHHRFIKHCKNPPGLEIFLPFQPRHSPQLPAPDGLYNACTVFLKPLHPFWRVGSVLISTEALEQSFFHPWSVTSKNLQPAQERTDHYKTDIGPFMCGWQELGLLLFINYSLYYSILIIIHSILVVTRLKYRCHLASTRTRASPVSGFFHAQTVKGMLIVSPLGNRNPVWIQYGETLSLQTERFGIISARRKLATGENQLCAFWSLSYHWNQIRSNN